MAPNIAAPIMKAVIDPTATTRLRKSENGTIGSFALRSAQMNINPKITTPATTSGISGLVQTSGSPLSTNAISKSVTAIVSDTAPA